MCDKEKVIALSLTHEADLQTEITSQKLCGNLNQKQQKALHYYLSSQKREHATTQIEVPKSSRCPVCGMFTHKYPKWVATLQTKQHNYYFDGVKDMMKFYFDPKRYHHDREKITNILVSDYYSLQAINAQKAYFVIGSNIYGPMGEELIPFADKSQAEQFLEEHHGKAIYTFDKIEERMLY